MERFIQIVRVPYEEPYHVNLIVKASNGIQAGELEIYDNSESLIKCADALEKFPSQRHAKTTIKNRII